MVKNPPAMQETPIQFLGREDLPGEGIGYPLQYSWASLVAQPVKNPPSMQETCVRSLGWEDPLEKGKGYPLQYSGLENSMDYRVHRVTKSQTQQSDFHFHCVKLNVPPNSAWGLAPGGPFLSSSSESGCHDNMFQS